MLKSYQTHHGTQSCPLCIHSRNPSAIGSPRPSTISHKIEDTDFIAIAKILGSCRWFPLGTAGPIELRCPWSASRQASPQAAVRRAWPPPQGHTSKPTDLCAPLKASSLFLQSTRPIHKAACKSLLTITRQTRWTKRTLYFYVLWGVAAGPPRVLPPHPTYTPHILSACWPPH